MVVVDTPAPAKSASSGAGGSGTGGGFKKGGFKSSFTTVSGGPGPVKPKKNVLGDDDEEGEGTADGNGAENTAANIAGSQNKKHEKQEEIESDTDEEYGRDDINAGGGYYDPRRPTGCFEQCLGAKSVGVR